MAGHWRRRLISAFRNASGRKYCRISWEKAQWRCVDFLRQEIISITDCVQNDQYAFSDETIGIISPTYDWGLPSIVKEFLKKASFQTEYLYYIATYGTMPGAAGAIAKKAIQGRKIDAYYSVRMVDTWTLSLIFPLRKKL